jgi:hypothetical protein
MLDQSSLTAKQDLVPICTWATTTMDAATICLATACRLSVSSIHPIESLCNDVYFLSLEIIKYIPFESLFKNLFLVLSSKPRYFSHLNYVSTSCSKNVASTLHDLQRGAAV